MGNRDVPEWILAEVTGLSKISCVRMKLICKQVINELLGGEVDFLKVQRLIPKGAGFTLSDIKAAVAAMHFILAQATRHGVEHSVLNQELQQLGLPKENSDGISRPFRNNRALLQRRFRDELVSLPRIRALEWRTDCVLASSLLPVRPARACAGGHETHEARPRDHLSLFLSFSLSPPDVRRRPRGSFLSSTSAFLRRTRFARARRLHPRFRRPS